MSSSNKCRVAVYIDGFNLYFGLKAKCWKQLYWYGIKNLGENLLKLNQELVAVRFCTSRIIDNREKMVRQTTFLEANQVLGGCSMHFGKYRSNPFACHKCGYVANIPSEKMTDVNIAALMFKDAYNGIFDTALLVTGDSDLVPAVMTVRELWPRKRVIAAFPPARKSKDLANAVNGHFVIGRKILQNSQMPDTVEKPDGHKLTRPWWWSTDAQKCWPTSK